MILHIFCFGPLHTNAILLGCKTTRRAAAVDPGVDSAKSLLKAAQKEDLRIEKILLTHSHWDHVAGVSELHELTGAEIYVHPLDRANVEQPGSDGIPLFAPIQGAHVEALLQDGDVVSVGELRIEVIHTPGHSPGGVCFYLPKEKLLLSGDTLFRGTIGSLSLPTASSEKMWPSLKKLAKLPPETRVIPGHGRETTIGSEKWIAQAEKMFGEDI